MCCKLMLDLHKFLAAARVQDESACNRLSASEIADFKAVVSATGKASARVSLIFKIGRLRTDRLPI